MMSPDQISGLATLIGLFAQLGGWPFGMMGFLIIGPWIMSLLLSYWQARRFEAVVRMYKNNVMLLEENEALAKDLKDVVIMNAQAFTRLNEAIEKNQFCPYVRLEKQAKGVQG